MKQLKASPINQNALHPYISCKDYTVSGEIFSIFRDETSELLVTSPRPNDADLEKYYESSAYISHTDARKSLFDSIYQLVRSYTIRQKIKLINSLNVSEKTILDIGAGTGDFLKACKNDRWSTAGVEPSKNARAIAEKKLNQQLQREIRELNHQKYDVISMWHVLEHVPNLQDYVTQLKRMLKDNGTLLIAVPNHKSFDAQHYGQYWAAYDVPRHLWHFSQRSIAELFGCENMDIVKTIPMKFDAYYVSLLSEKYKNGKMNPFKAIYVGFRSNRKATRTKEYSSLIYILKKRK